MNYKKILLALSDIKAHAKILDSAMDAADKYGAHLTVLHVSTHMAGTPSRVFRTFESTCSPDQLKAAVQEHNQTDVSASVKVVVSDDIVEEIVSRSKEYDLLVLGHEHMNVLVAAISDSIDEQVINKIHCDCLVVNI